MEIDYPLDYVPATPDDVLNLFRTIARTNNVCKSAADPAGWHLNMTLIDWCRDWPEFDDDLLEIEIQHRFEEHFAIELSIPAADWIAFGRHYFDDRERWPPTLGHFCAFLSRYIRLPRVRELRAFGQACRPGGVFLTLRSILGQSGVQVEDLRPSTELTGFARDHWPVFRRALQTISPTRQPPTRIVLSFRQRIHALFQNIAGLGFVGAFLFGSVVLFMALDGQLPNRTWDTVSLLMMSWYAFRLFHPLAKLIDGGLPDSVHFDELKTLGDLSRYLSVPKTA